MLRSEITRNYTNLIDYYIVIFNTLINVNMETVLVSKLFCVRVRLCSSTFFQCWKWFITITVETRAKLAIPICNPAKAWKITFIWRRQSAQITQTQRLEFNNWTSTHWFCGILGVWCHNSKPQTELCSSWGDLGSCPPPLPQMSI